MDSKAGPGTQPVKPLLTRLHVQNFMGFKSMELTAYRQSGVPYEGGGVDGKSSFVMAVLIGLGYDVLLENEDRTSLCGVQWTSMVQLGEDQSCLETTISLYASPHLQTIFGQYLTLIRCIYKDLPLKSSRFEICSSDSNGNCVPPKRRITPAELRLTLGMLDISAKWHRLLLLDEINLMHLVNHLDEWYGLYESTYLASKRKLFKEYLAMEMHLDKMERDIQWRLSVESHLDLELQKPIIKDSQLLMNDRENDIKALNKIRSSLHGLRAEVECCRDVCSVLQKELEELHVTFYYNMTKVFRKFLSPLHLTGEFLIDQETKQIGIYIGSSNEPGSSTSRTIIEAQAAWKKSSISRKKLGIIGLYLALWQVNDTCPIFAVDSYSSTPNKFKLPEQAMPVLKEILYGKAQSEKADHQQFVYTVKGSVVSSSHFTKGSGRAQPKA